MKEKVYYFLGLFCLIVTINIVYANNQQYPMSKAFLYKDLYYGMSKDDVMNQYSTEQNADNQNQLVSYNQSFIGFQWTMLFTFDNNSRLESIYLETDSDDNGNKLGTLIAALGKNFSPVYAIHDSSNVDFISILKTKDVNAYKQAIGDFFMNAISHSSSLNVIYISNDAFEKVEPKANNYMSLLQQIPDTARQAELVVASDEEDNIILGVDFTLPKMQILNMQNQTNENF